MADEEEVPEPEPEPEKTDEEKIAILRDQLRNGDIGPAKFDAQFVGLWLGMVEKKLAANNPGNSNRSLRRGNTRASLSDVNID
jgi:hypothetical protein|eukprot:jgi/Chrpa1/882/Chrysochromulina_OHIO_Genome00002221-RA